MTGVEQQFGTAVDAAVAQPVRHPDGLVHRYQEVPRAVEQQHRGVSRIDVLHRRRPPVVVGLGGLIAAEEVDQDLFGFGGHVGGQIGRAEVRHDGGDVRRRVAVDEPVAIIDHAQHHRQVRPGGETDRPDPVRIDPKFVGVVSQKPNRRSDVVDRGGEAMVRHQPVTDRRGDEPLSGQLADVLAVLRFVPAPPAAAVNDHHRRAIFFSVVGQRKIQTHLDPAGPVVNHVGSNLHSGQPSRRQN